MSRCEKCGKDTESIPKPLKKAYVCKECGALKGPLAPLAAMAAPAPAEPLCRAVVNVSTDEWVVMNKNSGAWLYTTGLIGCVGLVVESATQIALAHVLDRNHRATDIREAEYELELIVAVMGRPVRAITMVVTSDRETETYKFVRNWARRYVEDVGVSQGGSVLVSPNAISVAKVSASQLPLLRNPATGVQFITNWGKLPSWVGHTA